MFKINWDISDRCIFSIQYDCETVYDCSINTHNHGK